MASVLVNTTTLATEVLAVNADAAAVCDGLSPDQLGMRPDPASWSIAENLIHLCTTAEVFLPMVDRAMAETRRRGFTNAGRFELGWYGRILVWYVEPPPAIRLPAPKALIPTLDGSPEQALPKFLEMQDEMLCRIKDSGDLQLTKLRFSSPLASYIRMNLLEFFSVFNGHSRRHLWQATNVRRSIASGASA